MKSESSPKCSPQRLMPAFSDSKQASSASLLNEKQLSARLGDSWIHLEAGQGHAVWHLICGVPAVKLRLGSVSFEAAYQVGSGLPISLSSGRNWIHFSVKQASLVSAALRVSNWTKPSSFLIPTYSRLSLSVERLVVCSWNHGFESNKKLWKEVIHLFSLQ